MEQATLRPVPLRPAGPVDPAEALAHVLEALPELDEDAARALSLIEIAGRTRDQAGDETGLAAADVADALHRARKALRRSVFPLSASGWCERAERLLSDRVDGVLVPPGPARLDVHMRNCERCVDHERRLAQARERLVAAFIAAHPHAAGAGPADRAGVAELRVVELAQAVEPEPAYDGPTRLVPGFEGPSVEPASGGAPPFASFAGPGGQAEIRAEPRQAVAVETEDPADPAIEQDVETEDPADPAIEQDVAPAEPADATPSESDADAPSEPVVEPDADAADPEPVAVAAEPVAAPRGIDPAAAIWGSLTVLSVALAVFALVVTVLALSGLERVF